MNTIFRFGQFVCWVALLSAANIQAAIITFDDLLNGQTSYRFDGDGDSINDVVFSTTDPAGFNTIGPGANQSFINEPGLEATTTLDPDLRVDFLKGALGSISFGFALNSFSADPTYFGYFELFDAANVSLGSATVVGAYTTTPSGLSTFPEGQITVSFAGVAAYGLFNFEAEFQRFIIDDFQGNFGSTEIPEPGSASLLAGGLASIWAIRRRLV